MLLYIGPFDFAAIDKLPDSRKRPLVAAMLGDGAEIKLIGGTANRGGRQIPRL